MNPIERLKELEKRWNKLSATVGGYHHLLNKQQVILKDYRQFAIDAVAELESLKAHRSQTIDDALAENETLTKAIADRGAFIEWLIDNCPGEATQNRWARKWDQLKKEESNG